MVGGKRLSITTGCLNRVDFLRQSLKTWLAAPEPDEVIVVDWNNSVPLAESLSDFDDPRLVFARVVDQPYWKNAKCHNLELELATGELILRLDSDYLLGSDFIARHPMSRGLFYAGNWKPYAGDVEKCSLAGTLYACRDDVLSVNGYNEWLMYYGSEDDDLFERLTATGLDRFDVDLATIKHIPHPHRMRYENLEVGKNLPSLGSEDDWNDFARTLHLVHNSRNLATLKKWSTSDRRTNWHISRTINRLTKQLSINCSEAVADLPRLSPDVSFSGRPNQILPFIHAMTKNSGDQSPPINSNTKSFSPALISQLFSVARKIVDRQSKEHLPHATDPNQNSR